MVAPDALLHFFQCPGMYICRIEFYSAAAFVDGYNSATDGQLLEGWREWLIVKVQSGNNLSWHGLFLWLAFPGDHPPGEKAVADADQAALITQLGDTLNAFWADRDRVEGLATIMKQYQRWLNRQGWYRATRRND